MNQLQGLDVKDWQSLEAVSKPLNEAIVSICRICESLINAHVNPTTGTCSDYNQIRKHIEDAEQFLKISEQKIKEKLGYLDECMEQLTIKKQNVEQQKKEKQKAIDKLHIEINSANELLRVSEEALEQAKKNLESAKYALRVQEERKNTGEGMAIGGGVLLAIPIIGWIAGSVLLAEGLKQFNEAVNAVSAAEQNQQECNRQVTNRTTEISEYQEKISRSQNEIEQTSHKLKNIEWEIEEVQKHLNLTADIQEMVRRAVNLLSVLSGRVTVVETQTRRFILQKPVAKAMEEVMRAVVNIAENRLLYSNGVPSFINTLKENVGGLLAISNSPNNSDEHESYY